MASTTVTPATGVSRREGSSQIHVAPSSHLLECRTNGPLRRQPEVRMRLPEVDLVQPLMCAQEPEPVVVRDRDEGPKAVRHDALICAEGVTFARGGRETARRPYEYS